MRSMLHTDYKVAHNWHNQNKCCAGVPLWRVRIPIKNCIQTGTDSEPEPAANGCRLQGEKSPRIYTCQRTFHRKP
jgi:hypothetical protein